MDMQRDLHQLTELYREITTRLALEPPQSEAGKKTCALSGKVNTEIERLLVETIPRHWNPDKEYIVDEFHRMPVGTRWDSPTGQNPIDAIEIAKRTIRESFIVESDTIIIQHREKMALAHWLMAVAFKFPDDRDTHNLGQGILPDKFMQLHVRTLPIEVAVKHKWLDNAVLICKDGNDLVEYGCLLTGVLM